MTTPRIENRDHSALQLDEGFFPVATLSTDGKSMAIQIPPEIIALLTGDKIEKAVSMLRDAFYRVRPDLRQQ